MNFSKITETVTYEGDRKYEGGAGVEKTNVHYRDKCNFDKPRSGRLNKNHLQCSRFIKAILMIAMIFIYFFFVIVNIAQQFNPLTVIVTYYSLWGATIALLAQIFSVIACNREGWFKIAYISTEISYAVNTTIVIIFWFILWPQIMQSLSGVEQSAEITFIKWYQGLLHAVPMITTMTDLAITDMALEKSHWWIMVITMCPLYMCCNWWGAMTIGGLADGTKGKVYGPEMWTSNIPLTIFYFACLGMLQGGIFYCTSYIVDRIWPKRDAEQFDQKESLINEGGDHIQINA